MATVGEVTVVSKGKECVVEWKIKDFVNFPEDDFMFYCSPPFVFEGDNWDLWIHPNGTIHTVGNVNLVLYRRLGLYDIDNNPINVSFSFALKTLNGQNDSKKHSTKIFFKDNFKYIDQFISKSEFKRRSFEFLASGTLTVVCTLKRLESTGSGSGTTSVNCSYCQENVGAKNISRHEKKCMDRTIKCPACSDLVQLKNWLSGHECQKKRTKGGIVIVECSYCKKNIDAEKISMHEKKCMDRPIKCPECSEVILLQEWYDHQCQTTGVEERQPKATTGHHATQECRMPPESGISIHLEALSRDLSKLLDKSLHCDVRLICEGKTFNAHRIILGMRSLAFSAILESDMVEGEMGLIKVEGFSAFILQSFLRYLYFGTLPEMKSETVKQFYEIADKYAVEELKQTCSDFLTKNLSRSNACEILVLADQHSDKDNRKNIISYIIEEKIPQHDDCWLDFCKSYPIFAIKVLNIYVQKKVAEMCTEFCSN